MRRRTAFGLILLGIAVGLVSLELVLRLYVAVVVTPRRHAIMTLPDVLPDARLRWRGNPRYPGMDANGWRNASTPARVDIVALGDSQTYGFNVAREFAWPQRLSKMVRRSVYQMAQPGYGPGQYLLMFDEAAALRPKVMLVAYYFGNDDWDSYYTTYHFHIDGHANAPDRRALDALQSTDPRVRDAIRRAEAIDPQLVRAFYLDCSAGSASVVPPDPHLQQVHDILTAPPLRPLTQHTSTPRSKDMSLRRRVGTFFRTSVAFTLFQQSMNLELYRLNLFQGTRLFPGAEDYGPPLCVHFHDGGLRTVLAAGHRRIALDQTDPRMVEGQRISLAVFKELAERSRRAGIHFYVVVIPTKQTVFRRPALVSLRHSPVPPGWQYLDDVWNAEAAARARAFAQFHADGVNVIDSLLALEGVVAIGVNPYPQDEDEHPIAPGYEAIAQAVAARLQHDGFRVSP